MYNYSKQIESFRDKKVRLGSGLKQKLYDHRKSNRDRLASRLPNRIEGLRISDASFKPQGSMAVDTIIQSKFKYQEYDIDDGLVLWRDDLVDEDGIELTSDEVRQHVLSALKDKRFVKQPKLATNAVRVFYKEEDEERHHIEIPIYRKFEDECGDITRELASSEGWLSSDPTQVNDWFNKKIEGLNKERESKGTQFRRLLQLLKRFCRSRDNWDMPSGIKLTMLVAECQPQHKDRIDEVFRELLQALQNRLRYNKVVRNLAHPEKPELTRTVSDANIEELEAKIEEALEQLSTLDDTDNQNERSARSAWDWIFKSDGFFREYDEKQSRLAEKAELINSGNASTTACGVIAATGSVANPPHRFYGEAY